MSRSVLSLAVFLAAIAVAHAQEKTTPPAEKGKNTGSEVKLSADEKALVELANKARAEEKLPPLKVNALLCKAARQHTINMGKQEKMSHELDGKKVGQRVAEVGYDYRKVGENLAMSKPKTDADDPPPAPADIHKMWMESKGHRANILEPKYREIGINMGISAKGTYYYTVVFGVQRK
jgi:uncharacterized protein YkwD